MPARVFTEQETTLNHNHYIKATTSEYVTGHKCLHFQRGEELPQDKESLQNHNK